MAIVGLDIILSNFYTPEKVQPLDTTDEYALYITLTNSDMESRISEAEKYGRDSDLLRGSGFGSE